MGNFISNIFSGLASIPQGVGKFLYDAGIPDPMATAYGDKQLNQAKAQYMQFQMLKEQADMVKSQKLAKLLQDSEDGIKRDMYDGPVTNQLYNKGTADKLWSDNLKQNQLSSIINPVNKATKLSGVDPNFNPTLGGSVNGIGNILGVNQNFDPKSAGNGNKPWVDTVIKNAIPNPDYIPAKEGTTTTTPATTTATGKEYTYTPLSKYVPDSANLDRDYSKMDSTTAKAGSLFLDYLSSQGVNGQISSLFRDEYRNNNAEGSKTSNHLSGKGMDITFNNPEEQAKAYDQAVKSGWGEVINEGDHLHIGNFQGSLPDGSSTNTVTPGTTTTTAGTPAVGSEFLDKTISSPNLKLGGIFGTMASNPTINPYNYKQGMTKEQAFANNPAFLAGLGMTPDQMNRLFLTGPQNITASAIHNNLIMGAKDQAANVLAIRKELTDVAQKQSTAVQKAINDALENGTNPAIVLGFIKDQNYISQISGTDRANMNGLISVIGEGHKQKTLNATIDHNKTTERISQQVANNGSDNVKINAFNAETKAKALQWKMQVDEHRMSDRDATRKILEASAGNSSATAVATAVPKYHDALEGLIANPNDAKLLDEVLSQGHVMGLSKDTIAGHIKSAQAGGNNVYDIVIKEATNPTVTATQVTPTPVVKSQYGGVSSPNYQENPRKVSDDIKSFVDYWSNLGMNKK